MMRVARERLVAALAALWPGVALPDGLPEAGHLALCRDSREVRDSEVPVVFVALPGVHDDGRRFIGQALDAGAVLVLTVASAGRVEVPEDPRVVRLTGLEHVLGELGRLLFDVPRDVELIGVTGTNGKSSVTHYIAALSGALGERCGVIGTLGWGSLGTLVDSGQTTPGALELQGALGAMA